MPNVERAAPRQHASERLLSQVTYLYREYGEALRNRLYYGYRLARVKRLNTILEGAIAIGTSSAIAAWSIWRQDGGETAWAVLAGIATVLAVLKPILQLPKHIERYANLVSGHNMVYEELEPLVNTVAAARSYPKQVDIRLREVIERVKELALEDDPTFNKKLVNKVTKETLEARPRSYYWWPQTTSVEVNHEKEAEFNSEQRESRSAQRRLEAWRLR